MCSSVSSLEFRLKHKIPKDAFLVGHVGRFTPAKTMKISAGLFGGH